MIELGLEELEAYLREAFGPEARLIDAGEIGTLDKQGMKKFGYGKPVLVKFEVGDDEREGVLSVMRGDKYGHQFYWDRAAILMFQYETSARMERHVRPIGLGYVNGAGRLHPVTEPCEFFVINEKLEGYDYFLDLERIREKGCEESDIELARNLARWLGRIHAEKKDDEHLYFRRIRDLIGSSECITGLIDEAYPHPYVSFSDERFMALEARLVQWRWKLKGYAHRLSVVHGDFHPWNVLVTEDGDFSVLDRSRGEWGDPAGDVVTMATNYLLFGLYDKPRLEGDFERIYRTFVEEYFKASNDVECLQVMAPFFVFRCLVVASPEWYPDHPFGVRKGLFRLMENVLSDEVFDWENINKYME